MFLSHRLNVGEPNSVFAPVLLKVSLSFAHFAAFVNDPEISHSLHHVKVFDVWFVFICSPACRMVLMWATQDVHAIVDHELI
jgi:hypothetical protein